MCLIFSQFFFLNRRDQHDLGDNIFFKSIYFVIVYAPLHYIQEKANWILREFRYHEYMADGHTVAEALSLIWLRCLQNGQRGKEKYSSPSSGSCYLTNWNLSCGSEWSTAYPRINLKHGYFKLKRYSICGILFTKKLKWTKNHHVIIDI